MKKSIVLLLFSIVLLSCQTKTGTNAIAGEAVGATGGAVIGGAQGAVIGGAVGAVSGAMIGAALDEQDRKIMERTSPRTVERMDRSEPLTIGDIIKLTQGGVSDDTIIRYIHDTKTTYNLSQAQINRLQEAGVSQRVINYMIDTGK
ncbi:MAG: glycine zipper domain-containing protein [Parachlamydiales bacterium]